MYEDKSPASTITYNGEALRKTSRDLKATLSATSNKLLPQDEKELQLIASKVVDIAHTLEKELNKYKISTQSSKFSVLGKALKYNWSGKKRIDEVSRSLKDLQNTMQTRILVNLRYVHIENKRRGLLWFFH